MSRAIFEDQDLKKKHVYIIHGYNATPSAHWFPWLKQKLIGDGILASVLPMPNPTHPRCEIWLKYLKEHVHTPNQNTFFVAHSLGCITLLQYLSTQYKKIGGMILVSGFSTPLTALPELDEFTKGGFDPKRIVQLVPHRSVVASKDDLIVPYKQTEDLGRLLQARFFEIEKGGHFLASDGFVQLPIVYEELQKML